MKLQFCARPNEVAQPGLMYNYFGFVVSMYVTNYENWNASCFLEVYYINWIVDGIKKIKLLGKVSRMNDNCSALDKSLFHSGFKRLLKSVERIVG